VTAGNLFGLTVAAEDIFGNLETSFYDSITVVLFENPTVALRGTLTKTATQGVATFCRPRARHGRQWLYTRRERRRTGYKNQYLQCDARASHALVVSSPPPGTLTAGSSFGLTVSFEDLYGNPATTFDGSVTVALATAPAGGTLSGAARHRYRRPGRGNLLRPCAQYGRRLRTHGQRRRHDRAARRYNRHTGADHGA